MYWKIKKKTLLLGHYNAPHHNNFFCDPEAAGHDCSHNCDPDNLQNTPPREHPLQCAPWIVVDKSDIFFEIVREGKCRHGGYHTGVYDNQTPGAHNMVEMCFWNGRMFCFYIFSTDTIDIWRNFFWE